MRVLIVEDNPLIAFDIAEEVGGAGADVAGIAHSGEMAITLIDALCPDLVFMDVTLTDDLTGADVAQKLTAKGTFCVFITGSPEKLPETVAARWPVLQKPVTGAEIRQVLDHVRGLTAPPALSDG